MDTLRKILIDGEDIKIKYKGLVYIGKVINNRLKIGIEYNSIFFESPSGFCKYIIKRESCNGWEFTYVIRDGKEVKLHTLRNSLTSNNKTLKQKSKTPPTIIPSIKETAIKILDNFFL